MTHHDGDWGILSSQQDEDQARAKAVSDPAAYHAGIAAKELHWYDTTGEQWVSQPNADAWQGWHAASGAAGSADADWTPGSSALDASAAPFYRWCVDGQTNACFNLLDRHVLSGRGGKQALVFEGDRWDPSKNEGRGGPVFEQRLSYRELLVEVALRARVLETGADLGLAFDGDGDRLIMVDRTGTVRDGDSLLYVLAQHQQREGTLAGGVVGTLMSNLGLEQALQASAIPFARAGVGDRYVLAECQARGWRLGGEGSGHILCLDAHSTGDGMIAALQVLVALRAAEQSLDEALAPMTLCPQVLINVAAQGAVLKAPSVMAAVADLEQALGNRGRILLRASGTQPLVRVMVEGLDGDEVRGVASRLADTVRSAAASQG